MLHDEINVGEEEKYGIEFKLGLVLNEVGTLTVLTQYQTILRQYSHITTQYSDGTQTVPDSTQTVLS